MRGKAWGLLTFLAIEALVGLTVYTLAIGEQMNSRDGAGYSRLGMATFCMLLAAVPAMLIGLVVWRPINRRHDRPGRVRRDLAKTSMKP